MSGVLGGGGIKGQVADILIEVFDRYDIEPGELNENINDAVELVKEFSPVIREMQEVTNSIETDIEELKDVANEFEQNSEKLADSLDNMAESLDNFNKMVSEAANKKEKEE